LLYIDHENICVNVIGGGRDRDYGYLGFSHWSEDDVKIMSNFDNIKTFKPVDQDELVNAINYSLTKQSAAYINLKR
jgi:transketolase C-terminal domain/subunit